MSGHTPGPWWASTNGLEVGTVPMMDVKVAKVSGANYEEAKANARLIAACPDLLEALDLLLGKAYKQNFNDSYPEILAKAEAALARARGEQ